jgi:hypothetical protein
MAESFYGFDFLHAIFDQKIWDFFSLSVSDKNLFAVNSGKGVGDGKRGCV